MGCPTPLLSLRCQWKSIFLQREHQPSDMTSFLPAVLLLGTCSGEEHREPAHRCSQQLCFVSQKEEADQIPSNWGRKNETSSVHAREYHLSQKSSTCGCTSPRGWTCKTWCWEGSRHRSHVIWFHLCDTCRTGKPARRENGLVIARGWGSGYGE